MLSGSYSIINIMKKNILLPVFFLFAFMLSAQQSHNITFTHDGKTVNGTFKVPAGNKRFKTLILVPGSGANDRYGTLPMVGANVACLYPGLLNDTLRTYLQLADALQSEGYAVLIYDKLEYTYGASLGTITFHKLWLPVESAVRYVKTRPDVDTNNIILIGHSEGSSLIPYMAKGRKDIKALISIAGPRTPFDSLLAYQLVNIAQTCGGDVATAQLQSQQILAYFDMVRKNTFDGSTPALFGVPPAVWRDYVLATDPVADFYDSCKLPTLFLGFEKDINVPPAELKRFKSEVSVADDFWEIPSLIHYMTTNYNPQLNRAVPDTIIHWLRSNGFHSSIRSDDNLKKSISIQPNPINSSFRVSVNYAFQGDCSMTVRDLTGRIIATSIAPESDQSFDMSDAEAGVYILEILTEGRMTSFKLIKQ
jgi:dienelactone hydrolase